MANRLKFFFLISLCMLQINDAPVQIQVVMALHYRRFENRRRKSRWSPLQLRQDQALHRRPPKIPMILMILTQSICRSTTQMRKTEKRKNNAALREKPELLNVNEFWKQLALSLERMTVDLLLGSPINTTDIDLLHLFQVDWPSSLNLRTARIKNSLQSRRHKMMQRTSCTLMMHMKDTRRSNRVNTTAFLLRPRLKLPLLRL